MFRTKKRGLVGWPKLVATCRNSKNNDPFNMGYLLLIDELNLNPTQIH